VSRFGLFAAVVIALSLTALAARPENRGTGFPDLIQLPTDFGSEGIAAGPGHTFYVGSFTPPAVGQILVGDLRTGIYTELVPPTGTMAVGMKFDPRSNALFVAGGTSGRATVYNAT